MKKIFALFMGLAFPFLFAVTLSSCKKEQPVAETPEPAGDGVIQNAVKDYDGNTYNAVKLGKQVWMASNLRTTHYADGSAIPLSSSMLDVSGTEPLRYNPSDDPSTVSSYGYLYNWPAAMKKSASSDASPSGVQGICPNGWHMPSDAEWDELKTYVSSQPKFCSGGNSAYIAKALASKTGWDNSPVANTVGNDPSSNNATGFAAMPAGECHQTANHFHSCAYYWSTSDYQTTTGAESAYGNFHVLRYYEATMSTGDEFKEYGMSVRCVRN